PTTSRGSPRRASGPCSQARSLRSSSRSDPPPVAATAIVVPFHAADAVVGAHRRALTGDGADGMPAHVTLIYPFVDAEHLSATDVGGLHAVLDAFAPF